MLYSEFLTGTGAPDNMISYIIFSGLNRIYARYEECTKTEVYRDGQKILEDLEQVATVKRTVSKLCYYHGMNESFSFSCGHCGASVNEDDLFCRLCGAEFETNNRQEPDKRKEAEDNEK